MTTSVDIVPVVAIEFAVTPVVVEAIIDKTGPQGAQGDTGPQGIQGPQGEVGPNGPAGPQGPQGPQGVEGEIGPTGPQGNVGPEGPQGPIGLTGELGPMGPPGSPGEIGPTGPQGIQGEIGPTGPQGIQGEIGPAGTTDHTLLSNKGTNTHTQIDAHISDTSNPHGETLAQNVINAKKATVETTTIANTGVAVTADFALKGAYAYTVNGTAAITVSNLTAGQRGSISLYCDSSARTISWIGITKWLGTPVAELVASKLVIVTIFHDGVGIIASAGAEV